MKWRDLWIEEEGVTVVEYALLLALVATVALTAWTNLGDRVSAGTEHSEWVMPRQ